MIFLRLVKVRVTVVRLVSLKLRVKRSQNIFFPPRLPYCIYICCRFPVIDPNVLQLVCDLGCCNSFRYLKLNYSHYANYYITVPCFLARDFTLFYETITFFRTVRNNCCSGLSKQCTSVSVGLFGYVFSHNVMNSVGKNHSYYCLLLLHTYMMCFVLGLVYLRHIVLM